MKCYEYSKYLRHKEEAHIEMRGLVSMGDEFAQRIGKMGILF